MKKLKVIKGIIFVLIGMLFMLVKFYAINSVSADGVEFYHAIIYEGTTAVWHEFFKPTIFNFILGVLFIVIGTIEIKEAVTNGN